MCQPGLPWSATSRRGYMWQQQQLPPPVPVRLFPMHHVGGCTVCFRSTRLILQLADEARETLVGVRPGGPAVVWRDDKTVVNGAAVPEAAPAKEHLGVCHHAVREASAAGTWQAGLVEGIHDVADCLAKALSGAAKERQVCRWVCRR